MPHAILASADDRPSAELRRLSAGMRVVNALLCTLLLVSAQTPSTAWATSLLCSYSLWSAYVLWAEASGRALGLGVTARGKRADGSGFAYFDTRADAGVVLEIRKTA